MRTTYTETNSAIEATGLTKSYGEMGVLRGIDLRMDRGTVLALLGPNGAGKTTTVRILSTLLAADSGRARVAGFDIATARGEVRRRISLTGQSASVDELQTGEENLRMVARLRGLDGRAARRRATELLERFDLAGAARRQVGTYSGGMRRRLDLAAGLVADPSVLFLDEPTTGLDPRSRQAMWDVVGELVARGVSVLLTTQYLEEADVLADQIAVIDHGRIVACGTATELKREVAGARLKLVLVDAATFDTARERLGTDVVHADAEELAVAVATDGSARHVRDVLDRIDPDLSAVARFAVDSATLDDVFFTLTGRPTEMEDLHV
jgi:ABC-2 type transport system ATP-binding protein